MWLLSMSAHTCVFLYAHLHGCVFRSRMQTNICVCYSPLEVLILCHLAAHRDVARHLTHLMTALPCALPFTTRQTPAHPTFYYLVSPFYLI